MGLNIRPEAIFQSRSECIISRVCRSKSIRPALVDSTQEIICKELTAHHIQGFGNMLRRVRYRIQILTMSAHTEVVDIEHALPCGVLHFIQISHIQSLVSQIEKPIPSIVHPFHHTDSFL